MTKLSDIRAARRPYYLKLRAVGWPAPQALALTTLDDEFSRNDRVRLVRALHGFRSEWQDPAGKWHAAGSARTLDPLTRSDLQTAALAQYQGARQRVVQSYIAQMSMRPAHATGF